MPLVKHKGLFGGANPPGAAGDQCQDLVYFLCAIGLPVATRSRSSSQATRGAHIGG